MNIDECLEELGKKYTRCPFCQKYTTQIDCDGCIYESPIAIGVDKFLPSAEWQKLVIKKMEEGDES